MLHFCFFNTYPLFLFINLNCRTPLIGNIFFLRNCLLCGKEKGTMYLYMIPHPFPERLYLYPASFQWQTLISGKSGSVPPSASLGGIFPVFFTKNGSAPFSWAEPQLCFQYTGCPIFPERLHRLSLCSHRHRSP